MLKLRRIVRQLAGAVQVQLYLLYIATSQMDGRKYQGLLVSLVEQRQFSLQVVVCGCSGILASFVGEQAPSSP